MTAREHLRNYLEGLSCNDPQKYLPAMAEDYYMDDPNSRRIPRADIVEFMNGFASIAASIQGDARDLPLLEIRDQMTTESGAALVSWFWWSVPATPIAGAGLVRADSAGVHSETLTYYAKIAS